MSQDLFPLTTYSTRFSAWRVALLAAILWGVPMTLLFGIFGPLSLRAAVGAGVGPALLFGGGFTLLLNLNMRRLLRRLYVGDPRLVPPPPDDGYAIRVLASIMTSPRFAVGGHLYAGPRGLAFIPHKRNRVGDRSPRVMPWERVARVEPLACPTSVVARMFSVKLLPLLRVTTADGEWDFLVPEAQRVGLELEKYIRPQSPSVQTKRHEPAVSNPPSAIPRTE